MHCDFILSLLTSQKCEVLKSKCRCFKFSHCTLISFSASYQLICDLVEDDKEMIEFSHGTLNLFCLFSSPKYDLCVVKEMMFQVFARYCELIFCPLIIPKSDLGEVDKTRFQVVARHCELIFCLFTSPKYNLGEEEKAIIQLVARNFKLISCRLISSKCELVRSKKRCLKGSDCTINSFSASCPAQNATCVRSRK